MANTMHTGRCVSGAVLAFVLLLTGCSYGIGSSNSYQEPDCDGVLANAIQGVRADDSSGTTDSYFQWLTENCSYEYDILVDYTSTRGAASGALGPEPCSDLAQYLVPEAIELLLADGLCTSGSALAAPEPVEQPGDGIAWDAAVSYAGTEQRVCGPLVGDGYSEDDVFLNLGLDYPDPGRFQIIVWDVGGLEPIAYGSTLCTSGVITLYNGVAQIELYDPSRISIYE
ncbi:hypothetical protein [Agromyces binzhouensis]|uniref:Uncharacterized protein n=1 Tax=Agromyces binzhouensis TaxID=1817495 RepID=A0A4Q2JXC6_9MICO|nr:hypothetical protein [Agromyces binzhouensis]RXZ51916.1 hypothetical protein ESO86_00220 [Agromyces binzhouensis]